MSPMIVSPSLENWYIGHVKRCIAFAILMGLPFAVRAEDPVEDFRLIEASGNVAVIPAGTDQPMAASAGLPLSTGDRVVTGAGGTAELATKDGTVIHLEKNSSLGLEDLRSGWTKFRLTVGRFLGKFQHTGTSHYSVKTPVAVASVRGTEFAMDVDPQGVLDAGVVEGEVGFEPAAESESDVAPAPEQSWREEVLTSSQGLSVKPYEHPQRLTEIPRPLVGSLAWFPRMRERIPKLRDSWRDMDQPARMKLRQQSLRERVQWEIPAHLPQRQGRLRDQIPPRPIERRRPLRPAPKRP